MKKQQLLFWGLAVFLLMAGLLSGSRVFYVLLFCQAALLLSVLALNFWAVVTFTYTQTLNRTKTLRGRPVTLSLAIHNEKPVPFPLMRIRMAIAAEKKQQDLAFNLAPDSHMNFQIDMPCPYRGSYDVGMTVIDFLDLFGLMRLPFDMRLLPYYRMQTVLVYPRLVKLDRLNMPALEIQRFTRHQDLTNDHEQPYAMVRKYRPGDSASQIHWKLSLRQRTLMTRLYERASEPDVELILDLHRGSYSGEQASQAEDVFCECATALVYYLLRQNWHLMVTGYGDQEHHLSGTNLKDFQQIYNWLASVLFDGRLDFLPQMKRSLISKRQIKARVILTSRSDAGISSLLRQRQQNRVPVYMLVAGPAHPDPGEAALAALFRQSGLPIWFIHYGEDLAETLQGEW